MLLKEIDKQHTHTYTQTKEEQNRHENHPRLAVMNLTANDRSQNSLIHDTKNICFIQL